MTAAHSRRAAARAPLCAAAVVVLAGALTACSTTFTTARPAEYTADFSSASGADGAPASSLFATDSALLGDSDIARILAHRYEAPPLSRIALLPFGFSAWSGWSEELAIATADIESKVLATLMASPRVYDAALLPSILVPEKRTVPYLREAAARYQADLLLLFRSSCRTFERYRLFEQNQTRAFCAVESVLLDVRTGLVPFVATATHNYDLERSDEDLTFRETVLKAQLGAVAAALGDVSSAVTRFLEGATAASAGSAETPAGSGAAVSAPADPAAAPVALTRATLEYAVEDAREDSARLERRSAF
jgi:hypothetical protein